MSTFEPVEIERSGGHYRVTQDGNLLLSVPDAVFERYTGDAVFPPQWPSRQHSHPVRRLHWNPDTSEFLMAGLEAHPSRTTEAHSAATYRSFLHGFWIPSPPLLLLRPYWSPADPYDAFDRVARRRSLEVQQTFVRTLARLRPPHGWSVILNVTEAYLQAIGLHPNALAPAGDDVREVSLTPARTLREDAVAKAFERIALEHPGELFPLVQEDRLVAVHGLSKPALLTAQALLGELGIDSHLGPFRPH